MRDQTVDELVREVQADAAYGEAFAVVALVRSVGDLLTRMRERAQLSQTELAEKLGVTPGRVWQLESGTLRNAPSLKTIARWARACGETVEMTASGEPAAPEPLLVLDVPPGRWKYGMSGGVNVPGIGKITPRAVVMVEQAATKALKAGGVSYVDVVAGAPRAIGGHVELPLVLGREKRPFDTDVR